MSVGRVSLAYRDLSELTASVVAELSKSCKILDLTSNQISDLSPLRDLPDLEELILDDNKITSHTKIPPLLRLQNLWVNRNQINSLTLFIDKLVASCPNLIMLSMLNNEACPNYFNNGTPAQYQDYRYYVVNRLPKLQILDATAVSPAEKSEAQKKYGKLTSTAESEASRRAADAKAATKKRLEREAREQEKADEKVMQIRETKKANKKRVKPASSSPVSMPMPSLPPPPPPPPPGGASKGDMDSDGLERPSVDSSERHVRVLPHPSTTIESMASNSDDGQWSDGDDEWSSSSDI